MLLLTIKYLVVWIPKTKKKSSGSHARSYLQWKTGWKPYQSKSSKIKSYFNCVTALDEAFNFYSQV